MRPRDLSGLTSDDPEILYRALDAWIMDAYQGLEELAARLEELARPDDTKSTATFLADLDRRLPLDEVRSYVLSARHELHGGLTAITKARGRLSYRRPTSGDPNPPHPGGAPAERPHHQD